MHRNNAPVTFSFLVRRRILNHRPLIASREMTSSEEFIRNQVRWNDNTSAAGEANKLSTRRENAWPGQQEEKKEERNARLRGEKRFE